MGYCFGAAMAERKIKDAESITRQAGTSGKEEGLEGQAQGRLHLRDNEKD